MLIHFQFRKLKLGRPVLSGPVLDRRHFPGRGVLYSVLLHEIVFFGLLLLQLFIAGVNPPRLEALATINLRKRSDVMYFPAIPRVAPPPVAQDHSRTEAGRKGGVTYPGPQQIISNFEKPTNFIQTILQPAIQNPPILKPPLLIPNILQMANAAPIPKLEAPTLSNEVIAPSKAEPAVESAQPILPVKPETGAAKESPKFVISETILPAALPKSAEPLLALTPIPAAPAQPPVIPAGEARGNFAISPTPNLEASEKEIAAGKSGRDPDANTELGLKPVSSGINVSGVSSPNRAPSSAADPFEGITILGGSGSISTGGSASTPGIVSLGSPPAVESSYGGITVISTSSSGGGLPQFDVFSNETIYTVYFDMKRAPNDGSPSWIFEFGVPPENDRGKSAAQIQQGVILPFPISKEPPAFPAELVRKYLHQRIIVYAIIHTDGKLLQMSVKETPDAGLNEAVLTALGRWTFHPAQMDGASLPMKVLVGIPIYH
jgi:Gram-negative bacterial TonB protein C-terminal